MPAAVLGPIIGALGSVGGALIGGAASKNAAGQLVDAQGRVINQANQAVQSGQSTLGAAVGQGQAGLSQAAGAGQSGVSDATALANQTLQQSAQGQLAQFSPYTQAGADALPIIQQLAGAGGPLADKFAFNQSDLQNDPGYQFTLQQGQQAIQRAAAAQGGLFSAATSKALAGYTTGSANQYFNDAYNRAANTFGINRQGALSRLSAFQGLAGQGLQGAAGSANAIGSTSAEQGANLTQGSEFNANLGYGAASQAANLGIQGAQGQANLGIQGAGIVGNALTGQGNARAAGTIGTANAYAGGLNGITNSIQALLAGRAQSNAGLGAVIGGTRDYTGGGG